MLTYAIIYVAVRELSLRMWPFLRYWLLYQERIRPLLDTQQSLASFSLNFVAQLS